MSIAPLTVLGARGWIGSALVKHLHFQGESVYPIDRLHIDRWLADSSPASVVYAIGLTSDFRQRPYATVEAHVSLLSRVLQRPGVRQLLLLSSTRVYANGATTREDDPMLCTSSNPGDLYNISKLMGEALVLQKPCTNFKVVRLSNVVGPDQPQNTFLGQLLADARSGRVDIQQSAQTSKDYVALSDVVRLLPAIARYGRQRVYNLASGSLVTHREVANFFEMRGVKVSFATNGADDIAHACRISTDRLAEEFPTAMSGADAIRATILGTV